MFAGSFSATWQCVTCPANSDSPPESTASTDCICNPGYTGPNGGTCTECVSGTYKSDTGPAACTNCVAGQYSTAVGAASNVCQGCPPNSDALEASDAQTDCTCNVGSSGPDGNTCTNCIPGSYKVAPGSAACSNCVAGQYSTAVGATSNVCQGCPLNSNAPEASDAQTDCTCNAGWTGLDGGTCVDCGAGKYKAGVGSAACIDCVAGKYSTTSAAIIETTCAICPSPSTSPVGSNAPSDCITPIATMPDDTTSVGGSNSDGASYNGTTAGIFVCSFFSHPLSLPHTQTYMHMIQTC